MKKDNALRENRGCPVSIKYLPRGTRPDVIAQSGSREHHIPISSKEAER